ncbi:hypothetical protein JTE90_009760 [Oedothorax gibbosus]|uniref:Uncharacterized protein n=1 Tax=Oedothorax gibbosus TaxID=931172 RepID=A0AAV6V805_9ARAC|nr:hypothetical protein JTE90_009760 [Oedothorax gibbosus]
MGVPNPPPSYVSFLPRPAHDAQGPTTLLPQDQVCLTLGRYRVGLDRGRVDLERTGLTRIGGVDDLGKRGSEG